MATTKTLPIRSLALLTIAAAALIVAGGEGTTGPERSGGAANRPAVAAEVAATATAAQDEGAEPVLRIVGAWNGRTGERALERAQVQVGEVIVEVDGQPATLETWQQTMREIGRRHHEDMGGQQRETLTLNVRLQDGSEAELEVLGTSKVRDGDGWRYNAYTGAEVAEGADAPLLPEETGPEETAAQQAGNPEQPAVEPEPPICAEIRERFGPRPEGAPCWWLDRREDAELTEENRQRTIADPDGSMPWRTDWAFHPGVQYLVPPHRIPDGMEAAPAWQTAGAYQTSQARLDCPPGSRTHLLGSVRAGAWAAHAVACVDSSGAQQEGALIYAQPDPARCGASPWLWGACGISRTTLLNVVSPADGMRPDIPLLHQQEQDMTVGDTNGAWHLILPADPQEVPYLQERALRVG